jgi:hypothetical protein
VFGEERRVTSRRGRYARAGLVAVAVTLIAGARGDAQSAPPTIRAHRTTVDVRDGDEWSPGIWSITPSVRPDVYAPYPGAYPRRITFYTDVDSISFRAERGQTYDFVILLGDKDSAFTRIATPNAASMSWSAGDRKEAPRSADTIPFRLGKGGKIFVRASVNASAPLDMMLDLGSNRTVLSSAGVRKVATLTRSGSEQNAGFGGTNTVSRFDHNSVRLGRATFEDVSIITLDRADGDGILGFPLFDGKALLVDVDHGQLILSDSLGGIPAGYDVMPIRYLGGLPHISATISDGRRTYATWLEFDTGASGALYLSSALAAAAKVTDALPVIARRSSRGMGQSAITTRVVELPQLMIGSHTLESVPVDVQEKAIATGGGAGILGMDVLSRFNFVVDFSGNRILMRPNATWGRRYRSRPVSRWIIVGGIVIAAAAVASVAVLIVRRRRARVLGVSRPNG